MIAPIPLSPTPDCFDLGTRGLDFAGLKVLVFGLGRFGGGSGAARFFASRGAEVVVTDQLQKEQLREPMQSLADVPIRDWRLGGHDASDFERADWIVVNPAVPPGHPLLLEAQRQGRRLVTEIGLFLQWCPTSHVVGITGSNGKSTTTKLVHDILTTSGHRVHLGGNIGYSLLPRLQDIGAEDRVVLELSSFQLSRLGSAPRPRIVAITGLSSNHLDWHGSLQEYARAKEQILVATGAAAHEGTSGGVAVIPALANLDWSVRWRELCRQQGRRVVEFIADTPAVPALSELQPDLDGRLHAGFPDNFPSDSPLGFIRGKLPLPATAVGDRCNHQEWVDAAQLPLQGAAQRANMACAVALAQEAGATTSGCRVALQNFQALPHRQELVLERHGVRFVNDSKATTPEAALCALEAYGVGQRRVLWLAGGSSKQTPFDSLAVAAREHLKEAFLFGETAVDLATALHRSHAPQRVNVVSDLTQAFAAALCRAQHGDTILLSPACASYDQYTSYEQRGEHFRDLAANSTPPETSSSWPR